ncbi:hypothetical protein K438DRAFT_1055297 [Mycena galopus ATCC 62051]|nr:hypothetical protein K438DRAFT_1055297 [Mycena galopus ATCC 62051]
MTILTFASLLHAISRLVDSQRVVQSGLLSCKSLARTGRMFSWLSLAPGTDAGLEMPCFLGAMLVFDNVMYQWLGIGFCVVIVAGGRAPALLRHCNTPDVLKATHALFAAPRDANMVGEALQRLRIHFFGVSRHSCTPRLRRATGATPDRREPQHAPPAALWIAAVVGKAPQRHRLRAMSLFARTASPARHWLHPRQVGTLTCAACSAL